MNLTGFNPCPLCGSDQRMWATEQQTYLKILADGYGEMVSVGCMNCHLFLFDDSNTNYETHIKTVKEKWNKLGVQENG